MTDVRYMNRVDTKYIFSVSKLPLLLQNVHQLYQALEIDQQREFRYKTVYFDTPDLLFYTQHVTGKLNRTKVRIRTYETNGLTFLEVKQKSNKGRTSKSRMEKEPGDMNHIRQSREFLTELISSSATSLKPVINTGFTRITLVNLLKAERITIDYNITWNNLKGDHLEMPFLAIAEIKSEKSTSLSPFFQQLKHLGIRSTGFSKYAMGMALVNGALKQNDLKPKFLLLNRIRDEYHGNGIA
ncbi:MAG: polyphosphate polymerase domain-containing protein [Marinilabiliales bacterium]|nr:polyphosphate polymerase domain-containing protein [Marinilabiliales bacterium]